MTDGAIDKAWTEYVSAQYGPPQALRKREFIAGWKAAQARISELEAARDECERQYPITARLKWAIHVQLERPSNYDRRVTLGADDVLALIRALAEKGAAHNADEPTAEDYATGTYAPGAAE